MQARILIVNCALGGRGKVCYLGLPCIDVDLWLSQVRRNNKTVSISLRPRDKTCTCKILKIYIIENWNAVKLQFYGTVFLVTSSWHHREDVRNKSGVSSDFPVQLATRLPDWSAGGLLWCSAARLSVCRVVLPESTSTTRTTCYGRPRDDHRKDLRPTRPISSWLASDILASMSRGCYDENWSRGIPALLGQSVTVPQRSIRLG